MGQGRRFSASRAEQTPANLAVRVAHGCITGQQHTGRIHELIFANVLPARDPTTFLIPRRGIIECKARSVRPGRGCGARQELC